MIKKSGALFIAILYMVTVAGFALNLHYCGNRVASVKINTPAKTCGMQMGFNEKDCCKDIKVNVKVKDEHEAQPVSFLAKIFSSVIPGQVFKDYSFSSQQGSAGRFFDRGPPDIPVKTIPVFLKNCIFRI